MEPDDIIASFLLFFLICVFFIACLGIVELVQIGYFL